MATILPQPVEGDNIIVSPQPVPEPKKRKRTNRRTLWFMISLVIIAVVCLLAAFSYDYAHNKAQDNTRKQDLSYISNVLSVYNSMNHIYPTLDQINSSTFTTFAPTLDKSKFTTPDSTSTQLVAYPSDSNYAYQPLPINCNNVTVDCTSYKLIAVLNDGSEYIVASPAKN